MERMNAHHAEQLLVLRTTLLPVEKDSGVEAARDEKGKLTGGLHHEGEFNASSATELERTPWTANVSAAVMYVTVTFELEDRGMRFSNQTPLRHP
jgi:hypothetical protein